MPTYVYKCSKCGYKKDIISTIAKRNEHIEKCPNGCMQSFAIPYMLKRSMPDELSVPFNFEAYFDEHLADDEHPNGVWCTGHMQKKKLMREMGHEYKY